MIHVLVPEMPVNEVHIDTRFDHNADWLHLNETIDHITCHHKKISKYLFIICLFVYLFVSAADPDIPFKGRGMKWDWMPRELSGVFESEIYNYYAKIITRKIYGAPRSACVCFCVCMVLFWVVLFLFCFLGGGGGGGDGCLLFILFLSSPVIIIYKLIWYCTCMGQVLLSW